MKKGMSAFFVFTFVWVNSFNLPMALAAPKKATPETAAPAVVYVASKANKNKRFHKPSCVLAQAIKKEDKVTFTSKKDVQIAGYIPCKICHA